MEITAKDLAELLGGTLEGDGMVTANQISKIDQSVSGTLSFLANPKYEEYIYSCVSSMVLVSKDFTPKKSISPTMIRVEDPYAAFTFLLEKFAAIQIEKSGIEQPSFIDTTAITGENIYVGAFAYIGKKVTLGNGVKIYPGSYIGDGTTIGDDSIVYAGVKIYHDTCIGKNCIIHAGSVLGADGFGHAPQPDGSYKKIPQIGNVIIEDDVEIGASCTIDRATMGSTFIRKGAKLDNLIQVAHNADIGPHTVIAAQAGISGSTSIGAHCMIGGQVGFVGHISVAEGTKIGAQSGIMNHISEPGKSWIGSPIYEIRDSFKMQAVYRNLPELQKRVNELEQIIRKLQP